jgi:hypothetical protein
VRIIVNAQVWRRSAKRGKKQPTVFAGTRANGY